LHHSLALKNDGTVWAWGYNDTGQLGDLSFVDRYAPVQVRDHTNTLGGVRAVSAGAFHSLALKHDGTVWAWGYNSSGALGDGGGGGGRKVPFPVQAQNLTGATAVAAGFEHSLALKNDGTVWAWGMNEWGQLGDGTTSYRYTPVQVQDLSGITAIAAGSGYSLAVKNDGTVWAWGYNYKGALGDGTTADRHLPKQVQNLGGVTAVAAGFHSLALKRDCTVWAWGPNLSGELGDGSTNEQHAPVQVQNLTGITAIAVGNNYSLALKNDGTVWYSGDSAGQGSEGRTYTPAQKNLNGVGGVSALASGDDFALAVAPRRPMVVDRSGTPPADAPPTACVIPGLGIHEIAYRDTFGDLRDLWRDAQDRTGTTDLTAQAVGGAPRAVGSPFYYVDPTRNLPILLYRDANGTVRSLYRFPDGTVGHDNLSGTAGAPNAAGDPVGYFVPADDTHHVIYRTSDGHLHELTSLGVTPIKDGGDLTARVSAPHVGGNPTVFANAPAGFNFVVYRSSVNGEILSLYSSPASSGVDRLSVVAGTPPAAGDPFGYYTAHNDTHQIVYRAVDGHIYELYWAGSETVRGWDITPPDGAIGYSNFTAYYSAGTNTKHVFYHSADGHLHEIWWVPGGGRPAHVNLTLRFGAPPAADRPAGFTVEGPNTQHIAYRGTDHHIYELIW
jgi:hypothetical protein